MIDRYTKVILTVIAVALAALVARPLLEVGIARAGDTVDVRIVGIQVGAHVPWGGSLPVRCVEGC